MFFSHIIVHINNTQVSYKRSKTIYNLEYNNNILYWIHATNSFAFAPRHKVYKHLVVDSWS